MNEKIGRRFLKESFSVRQDFKTFEVTFRYSQNTINGVKEITRSGEFTTRHAGKVIYRVRFIKTCWQFVIKKTFPYVKCTYYNRKQVNRFAPLLKTGQFNVKEIRIRTS